MPTRPVTSSTGSTLKTMLFNASGQVWNGTAFAAYSAGSIASYGITTTESSIAGRYTWTIPATLPAGSYTSTTYRIAGANLATSDLPNDVWLDEFDWDGEAVGPIIPDNLTSSATSIGNFEPGATIADAFLSTAGLDFTDDTYTVTVYRNGSDTGEEATIGTVSATLLPYSYTLPVGFVAGNTGRVVLTNSEDEVLAVHRFSVGVALSPLLPVSGTLATQGDVEAVGIVAGTGSITLASEVTYAGPVPPDDGLPIVLYKGKSASLPFVFEDYSGTVIDGDPLTLRIMQLDSYEDQSAASYPALAEATATAVVADGTLSVTFALSAADTAELTAGNRGDGSTAHRMQILPANDGYPISDRECIVRRVIAASV